MAKKLHFLAEDPAEDISMPQTKLIGKPRMTEEQILALIGGIQDLHDLCLMYIGKYSVDRVPVKCLDCNGSRGPAQP